MNKLLKLNFLFFVSLFASVPLQAMYRYQQQLIGKIRAGYTTPCANLQMTSIMLPFVARTMSDEQCKKTIDCFFKIKDSRRELIVLQSCNNRSDMIKYALQLRHHAVGGMHYAPQCAIREYFCKLTRPKTKSDQADAPEQIPHISQDDLALYTFLSNAAQKYENHAHMLNRTLLGLLNHGFSSKAKCNEDVKYELQQWLSPYHPDDPKKIYPPLERAIEADNASIVKGCLYAGCDLDARDEKERTPFEQALVRGKLNSVKAFIEYGVPGLSKNFDHYLKLAQQSSNENVFTYLQEYRDNVLKKQTEKFATESIEGFRNCNVLQLLKAGVDVNQNEEFFKESPLYWRIRNKEASYSQCLLQHGANPNDTYNETFHDGSSGKSPLLRLATLNNDAVSVKALLDAKADPHITFDVKFSGRVMGKAPILSMVLYNHSTQVLRLLLEAKVDPNISWEIQFPNGSKGKYSPLMCALECNADQSVKVLLDAKAAVNGAREFLYPDTSLSKYPLPAIAVNNKDRASLQLLLDAKADVKSMREYRYKDGSTDKKSLLELAVEKEDVPTVKVLLDAKADPNGTYTAYYNDATIKAQNPFTLLATRKKNAALLRLLLDAKADPKNTFFGEFKDGAMVKVPILTQALSNTDASSVGALLDAKADPSATYYGQDDDDGTIRKIPLGALALRNNDVASARLLMAAKADPHFYWNGRSLLELAN